MSFPYSTYSELTQPLGSFYEEPLSLTDSDLSPTQLVHDPSQLRFVPSRSYSTEQSFIPQCPIPDQHCVFDDMQSLSPVLWDSPTEQEPYLNPNLVHAYAPTDLAFAPEAFSPGHRVSYTTENTYTRMFRGRKSKSASEVLDELRPYACDICQAAFARSHDRDRHKRSHTGETPYRCHGCGTGFKRPDARKRHWERDPACAQEDWLRVRHTPEGAKRRARAKTKPIKKQIEM